MTTKQRAIAILGAAVLLLAACGGDDGGKSSAQPSTTTAASPPLEILVTNDDGYSAEGIDAVVEALRALSGVTVTVVAPATNQSGSGSKTTTGALAATEATTRSGYPATAVDGYPADSVAYGLDQVLPAPPDLVVSGINEGQNLGPIAKDVSGTVGAAKAAAARGIPAFAASQGSGTDLDYSTAAALVVDWVRAHRNALAAGTVAPVGVVNLNVPTCAPGTEMRGLKQVPLATGTENIATPANCTSTAAPAADDDVDAFIVGYATVSQLTPTGDTVTTSTTFPPT